MRIGVRPVWTPEADAPGNRITRVTRVWNYYGWSALCRRCSCAIITATGGVDHRSQLAAIKAARDHIQRVHGRIRL
jgi:hypothetical protein